ncbi:MAG: molybdopterin oxidoreductase family protein [Alphaproteobacteria bacterium]
MPRDPESAFVPSVCPHDCPSTCALEVERLDAHTIGKVRGAAANSYTAGVVCAKVARYAERQNHPERLTEPLLRTGAKGEGRAGFVPIGWDEALDRVADALQRAAAVHGPEAVWPYFYAGTMGHLHRDGIDRLRHVMGYSRQYSTICVALADAGWLAGAGIKRGVDSREMADSDLIVIWGGNPVATQVNVMTHVAQARKKRGARLVVVDPYRTGTAEAADMHLMLRPGTDAALACAVMHACFRDGHADWDYMRRYTDDPDALAAHVQARDPDWAAPITGLSVDEIEAFAALYGGTERAFLRLGYGFSRARNGAANMHAAACLAAVTGKWRHKGGGALYANGYPHFYKFDKTLIQGLDRFDPAVRALDQSRIGPILTGDRRDLGDGPPVTALFIQNTNPVVVCPESAKVREGFLREDLFVCVHEQFMTETAAMADVVLPATTFLEHNDIYTSGGHTHLQFARKVLEPLGQCRSNHDVICALARRLGAEHPGFAMSDWEVLDATLRASGLPDAADFAARKWIDMALPFETAHFLDGFGHADGRWHFRADWSAMGAEGGRPSALPDHNTVYDAAGAERPFRMVAAPARQYLNTSFTETPSSRKREGRPCARIHPDDLAALGLADGDLVRLGNDRGTVALHAMAFDGLQRGVVVVESIWPNAAFVEGIGINALTSADPGLPGGGAVFHDTAVWIRAA